MLAGIGKGGRTVANKGIDKILKRMDRIEQRQNLLDQKMLKLIKAHEDK